MQGLHRDSVGPTYLPLLQRPMEKYMEIDVETGIEQRQGIMEPRGPNNNQHHVEVCLRYPMPRLHKDQLSCY